MKRKRDLLVTNLLAVLVLLAALVAGWREAAAFGLAVLVIMDLLAVLGERWPRRSLPSDENVENSTEDGREPTPEPRPGPEQSEPDE